MTERISSREMMGKKGHSVQRSRMLTSQHLYLSFNDVLLVTRYQGALQFCLFYLCRSALSSFFIMLTLFFYNPLGSGSSPRQLHKYFWCCLLTLIPPCILPSWLLLHHFTSLLRSQTRTKRKVNTESFLLLCWWWQWQPHPGPAKCCTRS